MLYKNNSAGVVMEASGVQSSSSIEAQREVRIEKLKALREKGVNPFAISSFRHAVLKEIKDNFVARRGDKVTLCGRLKSKRGSGKIAFATMEDESLPEGFQFIFKQDLIKQDSNFNDELKGLSFEDFKKLIDEGDYLQASGVLEESQRGEPSLFVESFTILTKALRPLPDKLSYDNVEERYLNRVADFKMNTKDENGLSVREMLRLKSKYWQIWREEMQKEGFLEIETPAFKLNPSGAEAMPFATHYNELGQEVYLRMELELAQKALIAGGFERIFEIGRQFRNEGGSPQHLQDYTQIEWYGSYLDYEYGMRLTKRIYTRIIQELLGTLEQVDYKGNKINLGDWCSQDEASKNGWELLEGWPKIPYYEAMRYFSDGKVDVEGKDEHQLVELGKNLGLNLVPELGLGTLMDKIWKKVRVNVKSPIFLILPPVELEPLAKKDIKNEKLTQRFQVVAGGAELGKGFSELNDPLDQLERFESQQAAKDAGNEEAMGMDEEYVKSLEYGTPPMAGFGTSERFVSFILGKHIRELSPFPYVKSNLSSEVKSKQTQVAHAVILNTTEVPTWTKLNAAAHLSAAFAANKGNSLFHFKKATTADGLDIPMNIQHAIIMKQAANSDDLLKLYKLALAQGLTVSVFTEEMKSSSDDAEVSKKTSSKTAKEVGYLGVLVFGKKSSVEKITQNFDMFN